MRQRLHHGRGNRKPFSRWAVLPWGWDDFHRPVAEGTMTARVELRKPGIVGSQWNPVTEQDEAVTPAPYYSGWARVQRSGGMGAVPVNAEDPEHVSDYLVTLPADADGIEPGDLVFVIDSGDPLLDAQPLTVTHLVVGSLRFERDLFCTLNPVAPPAGGDVVAS